MTTAWAKGVKVAGFVTKALQSQRPGPGFLPFRFDKYDEVRVVLPGVNCPHYPTHAGPIAADYDEEVFGHEPFLGQLVDDLDVGQTPAVGTDLRYSSPNPTMASSLSALTVVATPGRSR